MPLVRPGVSQLSFAHTTGTAISSFLHSGSIIPGTGHKELKDKKLHLKWRSLNQNIILLDQWVQQTNEILPWKREQLECSSPLSRESQICRSLSWLMLLLQHLQQPKLCEVPSYHLPLPTCLCIGNRANLNFFPLCFLIVHSLPTTADKGASYYFLKTFYEPSSCPHLLCLMSFELPLHWLWFLLTSSTPADCFCSSQLHGGCPREGTNLLSHSLLSVINTKRWGGRLRLTRLCLKGSVILPSFSLHFSYF